MDNLYGNYDSNGNLQGVFRNSGDVAPFDATDTELEDCCCGPSCPDNPPNCVQIKGYTDCDLSPCSVCEGPDDPSSYPVWGGELYWNPNSDPSFGGSGSDSNCQWDEVAGVSNNADTPYDGSVIICDKWFTYGTGNTRSPQQRVALVDGVWELDIACLVLGSSNYGGVYVEERHIIWKGQKNKDDNPRSPVGTYYFSTGCAGGPSSLEIELCP